MDKRVSIWYDPAGDMLEVWWGTKPGHYSATEHDRIEAHLDSNGEVQGFQVFGVSNLDSAIKVDLLSPKPARPVADD